MAYSADDEGSGRFESGIRSELDKLIDESEQAFKTHLGRTRFWRRMDVSLGLPAAITAAAAGATGLASAGGRIPAAIIALVSAALSAAVVFLRAEQQVKSHTELSAAWAALAADASMARNVRLLEPRGLERVSRELRGLYAWRNNLLRGVSSAELPERREAGDQIDAADPLLTQFGGHVRLAQNRLCGESARPDHQVDLGRRIGVCGRPEAPAVARLRAERPDL